MILKHLQLKNLSMKHLLAYRNKFSIIPKLQSFMAKRLYTYLLAAFCLLSFQTMQAQQVTLSLSPSSLSPAPNVGDVVALDVIVKNFTNIETFQYTMEWDASLFQFVNTSNTSNLPDNLNFQTNLFNSGALTLSWSTSTSATLPDGSLIYRLNMKVLAASTNYWMQFSGNVTGIEIVKSGVPLDLNQIIFGSLGVPPSNKALSVTSSTHQIPVSGKVCVGVTTTDFTNLTKANWNIKWDSTILKFDSLSKLNTTLGLSLGASFTTTQAVANGRLNFNFTSTTPKTVPTGDTLFKICYSAIGANNTSTPITSIALGANIVRSISGTPNATTLNATNGIVTIKDPVGPGKLTFSAQNANGNVGDTLCVRVFTKNFKDLAFMKMGMRWDSTKLSFVKARLLNATLGNDSIPTTTGSFTSPNNRFIYKLTASGSIAIGWDDPTANGVTFTEDSTLILDLCFKLIGLPGSTSSVYFDRYPFSKYDFQRVVNGTDITPVVCIPAKCDIDFFSGTVTINNVVLPPVTLSSTKADVNCNGGSDGSVALTPGGGNGSFTYAWKGPNLFVSASKDIAALKAGKYYVTVSSGSATPKIDSFTIAEPSKMAVSSKTIVDVKCNGQTTGSVTLTVTGGTGAYTYLWSGGGETSATLNNKAAGSYFLTITDAKNCVIKDTSTITQPAAPISITPTLTNVKCNGGKDGAITLLVAGGTPIYTYNWTGPGITVATTKDITTLLAGDYRVTATDSKGCAQTAGPLTLTQPTAVSIGIPSVVSTGCSTPSGSISITPAGGTALYTYSWTGTGGFGGASSKDIAGLPAGDYRVTITDNNACPFPFGPITVNPATPITIGTPSITNTGCGAPIGAISITPSNGTMPYTYSWSGPNFMSTSKDITGLAAGDYRVTVTDAKSCSQPAGPFTVGQPLAITVGTPSVTNTGCGTSVGAISISPSNGTAPYTFMWTGSGYANSNQNISNLAAGSYVVKITDANNCSVTSTPISVSSTGLNLNVTPTITNIDCNGNNNGAIALAVTGGSGNFTYTWTGSGPTPFMSNSKDISALSAGSYTVTIKDANNATCEFIPSPYTITVPSVLTVSNPQITNITCKGASTGAVSISVNGGTPQYSYAWTGPNPFTATNTPTISNLIAGTYNVVITDAKGCKKNASATVTEPATGIAFGQTTIVNVKCFGTNTGSISVPIVGGTAPFTGVGGTTISGSTAKLENLAAGNYRVSITDANGCPAVSTDIAVTQPASAISIAETIVRANDACNGSITLVVSGGTAPYTFAWGGAGANPTAQNQTDLCPGTYTLTVTDANDCRSVKSFNVPGTTSPPIRLTDSVITNAGCPGGALGAISINFVGGRSPFTFAWYNQNAPNTVVGILQNISGLTAGKYYVKISDGIQSYQSGIMEIKGSGSPVEVVLTNKTNESCAGNDAKIDISVSGGAFPYTYQWDKVVGNIQDLTNIQANTYSVTVTDVNKCAGTLTNIIVERTLCPLIVNLSDKKDVKCNSAVSINDGSVKVNIENGEPGYVIAWGANNSVRVNNASRRDGSYTITGLAAGSYIITVTDAKNQTTTLPVEIKQPAAPLAVVATVVGDSGSCSGSIILVVTGGTSPYRYRWTDLAGNDHQRDRFSLCAGKILSVEVTDANGCTVMTDNLRVSNSIPALSLDPNTIITNANCADDFTKTKIDITPKGGIKPYKYKWSNPNGSETEDLTGVPPGKYRVTLTDASLPNPQVVVGEFEVSAVSNLQVNVSTTQASSVATNDGTATVTIIGGLPPYSVKWCVGQAQTSNNTTVTERGLAVGACSVEITDGLGCTKKLSFEIKSTGCAEVRVNTVFTNGFNIKCFDDKNASATVVTVNDTTLKTPFAYLWDTNESGPTAIKLPAGARTVTIKGSSGKSCVASFVVKGPDEMKVDVIKTPTDCGLQAIVRGGTGPLKYLWTPGTDTTSSIKNLKSSTNYYVLVTDANKCQTAPQLGVPECREFCLQGSSIVTPDDDGANDFFKIEKCQFSSVRLQIFSRWGEMVYENADYTDQWKGKSGDVDAGRELPEGVYFYVLRALKPNGIEETNKGTVTILRQL